MRDPLAVARGGLLHRRAFLGGALAIPGAAVGAVEAYWPYATTLFDYLRRAMPYEAPGSLTNDELYALTAWVLHRGGVVNRDERLDRESLPRIAMPHRGAFRSAWEGEP